MGGEVYGARSPSHQFDKNTGSGQLGIKHKAEAHFLLFPRAYKRNPLGNRTGPVPCLELPADSSAFGRNSSAAPPIGVYCCFFFKQWVGEEEEVGGARHDRADPKAHAGRDGCVGVFRTCTHQSVTQTGKGGSTGNVESRYVRHSHFYGVLNNVSTVSAGFKIFAI